MNKVIFYFDGFNFYNGLKDTSLQDREWKNFYWLDFIKFCNEFLDTTHELVSVKYFTAPPSNNEKRSRQSALFSANKLLHGDKFQVINGQYLSKEVECKATCGEKFSQLEEKRTDVSISTNMLLDCFNDVVDTLILVSADSDQIPTIQAIKKQFPHKKVKIYFPPNRRSTEIFDLFKPIVYLDKNLNKFQNSVLPTVVKNEKKTYTRPANWKK